MQAGEFLSQNCCIKKDQEEKTMQRETDYEDVLDAPTPETDPPDDDVIYLENPYGASKRDVSELYRQIIARLIALK